MNFPEIAWLKGIFTSYFMHQARNELRAFYWRVVFNQFFADLFSNPC